MVNRHHAYRLLQCLTVAFRPLLVEELAEILALDFDNTKDGVPQLREDWRGDDQQEEVLSLCSSLIAVVKIGDHRMVQFSHFSVKEFLTSDRKSDGLDASKQEVSHVYIPPEPAHTVIVKACLGILLRSGDGMGAVRAKSSALDNYAAEHWMDHAQFKNVSTHIENGMRRLYDPAKPYFKAWLDLYDVDNGWYAFGGNVTKSRGSPLYYASFGGLRNLTEHLIDKHPMHINATLGQCLSPLVAALYNGHFDIADLLYKNGAVVDIMGGNDNRTPLYAAVVDEDVDIAEWLLAHGANATSSMNRHETPLHFSVRKRKFQFVQMLLKDRTNVNAKTNVNVNAKNGADRTPLHLASEDGQVETVRLLLQLRADIDARDTSHSTPLHLALRSRVGDKLRNS